MFICFNFYVSIKVSFFKAAVVILTFRRFRTMLSRMTGFFLCKYPISVEFVPMVFLASPRRRFISKAQQLASGGVKQKQKPSPTRECFTSIAPIFLVTLLCVLRPPVSFAQVEWAPRVMLRG